MAKTIAFFREVWSYNNTTRIFSVIAPRKESLWVESFENGVVTIDPIAGCNINDFALIVAGCFDAESNFGNELKTAFNCDDDFATITFVFNGATVTVNNENADANKIIAAWRKAMDDKAEQYRREREAYYQSPEGQAELAKEREEKARLARSQKKVMEVDETTEILFKDDEAAEGWDRFVENNSKDAYSKGVVTFARRWAKYMQYLMEQDGKQVHEIAEQASHDADIEGITGFMYGCAVNTLSHCWKYGEELRKWHNKDFGYEGDGVVNPALLTVG